MTIKEKMVKKADIKKSKQSKTETGETSFARDLIKKLVNSSMKEKKLSSKTDSILLEAFVERLKDENTALS